MLVFRTTGLLLIRLIAYKRASVKCNLDCLNKNQMQNIIVLLVLERIRYPISINNMCIQLNQGIPILIAIQFYIATRHNSPH